MLKFAICDDDKRELGQTSSLLEKYRDTKEPSIIFDAFFSPLELIAAIEKGKRYDVILLDVVMPGLNGIQTAKEIRLWDTSVKIIFLTSSPEFAVQSYAVGAYFYQLKPIWEDSFFRLVADVLDKIGKQNSDSLVLKCKTGVARIPLDKLEYCEVIGKTIVFHLTDGQALESVGSMDKISEDLAAKGSFFRVHRSYTVNLDLVHNITYQSVTMASGADIPLPRGKYQDAKDAFLANAFEMG